MLQFIAPAGIPNPKRIGVKYKDFLAPQVTPEEKSNILTKIIQARPKLKVSKLGVSKFIFSKSAKASMASGRVEAELNSQNPSIPKTWGGFPSPFPSHGTGPAVCSPAWNYLWPPTFATHPC